MESGIFCVNNSRPGILVGSNFWCINCVYLWVAQQRLNSFTRRYIMVIFIIRKNTDPTIQHPFATVRFSAIWSSSSSSSSSPPSSSGHHMFPQSKLACFYFEVAYQESSSSFCLFFLPFNQLMFSCTHCLYQVANEQQSIFCGQVLRSLLDYLLILGE